MIAYSVELHQSCFSFLDEKQAQLLLETLEQMKCPVDTLLTEEGKVAGQMYFLIEGRIAVHNKTGFGDRT